MTGHDGGVTGNIYPQRLLLAVLHSTFQGGRVCVFVLPTTPLYRAEQYWQTELPECEVSVVPLGLNEPEWKPKLRRLTYAPVAQLPTVWVFADFAYSSQHKRLLSELSGHPILLARTLIPGLLTEWHP